jgi:hypothetical protein
VRTGEGLQIVLSGFFGRLMMVLAFLQIDIRTVVLKGKGKAPWRLVTDDIESGTLLICSLSLALNRCHCLG